MEDTGKKTETHLNGDSEKTDPKNWEAFKNGQTNGQTNGVTETFENENETKSGKSTEVLNGRMAERVGQKRKFEDIDCITIDSDDETDLSDKVIETSIHYSFTYSSFHSTIFHLSPFTSVEN